MASLAKHKYGPISLLTRACTIVRARMNKTWRNAAEITTQGRAATNLYCTVQLLRRYHVIALIQYGKLFGVIGLPFAVLLAPFTDIRALVGRYATRSPSSNLIHRDRY